MKGKKRQFAGDISSKEVVHIVVLGGTGFRAVDIFGGFCVFLCFVVFLNLLMG